MKLSYETAKRLINNIVFFASVIAVVIAFAHGVVGISKTNPYIATVFLVCWFFFMTGIDKKP